MAANEKILHTYKVTQHRAAGAGAGHYTFTVIAEDKNNAEMFVESLGMKWRGLAVESDCPFYTGSAEILASIDYNKGMSMLPKEANILNSPHYIHSGKAYLLTGGELKNILDNSSEISPEISPKILSENKPLNPEELFDAQKAIENLERRFFSRKPQIEAIKSALKNDSRKDLTKAMNDEMNPLRAHGLFGDKKNPASGTSLAIEMKNEETKNVLL